MLFLTEVLIFIISILFGLYIWIKYRFSYWQRKNVACVEPNFFFGNIKDMLTMSKSCADNLQDLYSHENAKDQPCVGIHVFSKPVLLVREPELIKSILVKNFSKFSDRYATADTRDTLGSGNLFFIKNPDWKELRTKLTPVFTSGKMKQMFSLVEEVGNELDNYLCSFEVEKKTNSCILEVKEISALYTTDVIATVAFGIQANSLRNPEADFRRNGRSIFHFTLWRAFEFASVFFLPSMAKLMKSKIFPKESEKFIRASMKFVMEERIKNGNHRNDLIDVLIAFKKKGEFENDGNHLAMNDEILIAQAALFFIAGYETSSSTMSFGLYELAKNFEVQKRLREEIREVLKNNNAKLTYEAVNKMEYLNMVMLEVLRMYPPLPFLDRTCTLPKDEKEFSLKPYCDFAIPNNMPVYIPMFAIQRDPDHFPNPETFDPDRFSEKNKSDIKAGTYMPFGLGPHNCIGERFGLIQSKVGLINFLKNHYVTTCDKSHENMQFEPKALIIQSKGGIFCRVVRDSLI